MIPCHLLRTNYYSSQYITWVLIPQLILIKHMMYSSRLEFQITENIKHGQGRG